MAIVWLLLGVFACSTSVLWIKFCAVDPVLLTALRLGIAATCLAPLAVRDWRRHRDELTWRHLTDAALPGLFLAAHFVSWIFGARQTLASNGVLVVNMTPIVTPFLLAALMGERVNRREVAATLVAGVGLAILFGADYQIAPETLRGDLICFGSMTLYALYMTLGRKYRHHPTNTLYMVPVFAFAALAALAAAPWLADDRPIDWRAEAPWILLIAIAPTIIGHSLIVAAMRRLRGQTVFVLNMTQFVFATLMAWPLLGEVPTAAFYPAAALILVAGLLILGDRREPEGDPSDA